MNAFNENVVKGKWREIRGEIRKAWGRLTDDELDKTKGDMQAISGLIQQRYGEAQEQYDQKLEDIFHKFQDKKDDAIEEAKDAFRN